MIYILILGERHDLDLSQDIAPINDGNFGYQKLSKPIFGVNHFLHRLDN